MNDLFFLLIMTLNLSKSVKLALFALTANFFASAVAFHFPVRSKALAALLYVDTLEMENNDYYATVPDLLPLRTPGTTRPVGVNLLRG